MKNNGDIKTFSEEKKCGEFVVSKPILTTKMLMEILKAKKKLYKIGMQI